MATMAMSLEQSEKRSDRSSLTIYLSFAENLVKVGLADPEIFWLHGGPLHVKLEMHDKT